MSDTVLVVGATGLLGNKIARKLLAGGVRVRALARNQAKLAPLGQLGAELAPVDLLNVAEVNQACRGVTQIIATANNNMGSGPTSPRRVDLNGYQNLCAAARSAGVRRLVFVSFRGLSQDTNVDIFRLKWFIEDAIKRSGLPHVMLRPTASTDIWVDILASGIRKNGITPIFGDGNRACNYIASDDVAEFAVRVLAKPEIINEVIELGGPSNITLNEMATMVERQLGRPSKRRHVPVLAMKLLPMVVKPFNEVTARLMTIGHYAATETQPFADWKKSADRFGVQPMSVEQFVKTMTKS